MRGPIDYIVVGFEGDSFDGSVLKAISGAIDKGVIDVLALSFIHKDVNGTVSVLDLENTGDTAVLEFAQKYTTDESLVTKDDIEEVADIVESNTSVGLLVIEQLWAKPLKEALLKANGVLVAEGRIHPDAAYEIDNKGGN